MHRDTPKKKRVFLGFKSRVLSCTRDVFTDIHSYTICKPFFTKRGVTEFCKSQKLTNYNLSESMRNERKYKHYS